MSAGRSDHDGEPTGTLPTTKREFRERYERLFSGAINDVLRDLGYLRQTLPHTIRPLRDDMKLAGFAFTIAGAPKPDRQNDMELRAALISDITEDTVCVWETDGDNESAQWGEVMNLAATRQGSRGVVIDGGVRDTDKVLAQGARVFCRYRTSSGMQGRFRINAWQKPITVGGVVIRPDDLVFGDIDGVIVVPHELIGEVLLAAEQVKRNEVEIKHMIVDGASPQDVVARGGYF